MSEKSFLARKTTRIYLECYLVVLALVFVFPVLFMFLVGKNTVFFGANILFFEFNMFLSLVLLIYTFFTRYENSNWRLFFLYFILSILFLVASMLILGGGIYFKL